MPEKLNQRHLDTHMEQLQQRIKQDSNHQINPCWRLRRGELFFAIEQNQNKVIGKKVTLLKKIEEI